MFSIRLFIILSETRDPEFTIEVILIPKSVFLLISSLSKSPVESLKRLKTDYIDLYQTHWPDHDTPYLEILGALDDLVQAGKVRVLGSSNETCWGVTKASMVSEMHGLSRYETIQNNFSLNNRRFEDELAQACRQEQVSLIPYSPLAGGVLSGKYNDGALPEGAR